MGYGIVMLEYVVIYINCNVLISDECLSGVDIWKVSFFMLIFY